jgi:DNA replicative helicase MCM subunit Mcm2 (Cdc46/Mcm family)
LSWRADLQENVVANIMIKNIKRYQSVVHDALFKTAMNMRERFKAEGAAQELDEGERFLESAASLQQGSIGDYPRVIRHYLALIRLAEAHARLHLRETVDEVDVAESCRLMDVTTSMLSREESADGFRERNNAYADDFSLEL